MAGFVANLDRAGNREPQGFAPRRLAKDPEQFGQNGDPLEPADDVDPADPRFIAANLQHWVANSVREGVLLGRTNLATMLTSLTTTSPEMGYDRVLSTLRGYELMQLHDLVTWSTKYDSVRSIVTLVLNEHFR
ncbi:MAG TPA: hypothetical protein VFQ96_01265 [Microbacteriaceae bacterium]|nr:hypothetical protein [Microbacteriaceae bacterium]